MNSKIIGFPALMVFLAGCSQIHTSDYKKIDSEHNDVSSDIDELKVKSVAEINGGSTLDEFFVKLSPIKVKAKDTIVLPDYLPNKISVYHGTPLTEAELSQILFLDYGIKVTFNRMIIPKKDVPAEGLETQNIETSSSGEVSLMNLSTPVAEGLSPTNEGKEKEMTTGMKDMFALFGNNVDGETDKRIQKISYNGALTGFFDWLSLDRGLSWKYHADTETFILYDLDTIVFDLIDNTDKSTIETTVNTSSDTAAGSSEGTASSNSSTAMKTTLTEESEHWEDLQKMINQMLSPNGLASFDVKNGRVAITDNKHSLEKIGSIIDQLNSSSEIQVLLNLTYIKLSVEQSSELGVNLSATDLISGAITGGASAGGQMGSFQNIFNMSFTKAGVNAAIGAIGKLGTISYQYDSPILTMNNRLTPFQSVEEEHYISEVEVEIDDNNNEKRMPKKDINKTGITSNWKNRVFRDKILVEGKLNLIERISMEIIPDMNNIALPKNALDTHDIKAMLKNGHTKVVSINEIKRKVAESSGPFGSNSFFLGGSEKTVTRREISLVLVTPYIIK